MINRISFIIKELENNSQFDISSLIPLASPQLFSCLHLPLYYSPTFLLLLYSRPNLTLYTFNTLLTSIFLTWTKVNLNSYLRYIYPTPFTCIYIHLPYTLTGNWTIMNLNSYMYSTPFT